MSRTGRPLVNIIGRVFGNVTVMKVAYRSEGGHVYWECRCICNQYIAATHSDLRRGKSNECERCRDEKSKLSPLKTLYGNYKRGAEQRYLDFDLSIEEFQEIINKNCYYCDSEPMQFLKKEQARHGIVYNGIDRKDNEIGYILENCVPCCKFCNFAKRGDTLENFQAWLERVRNKKSSSSN